MRRPLALASAVSTLALALPAMAQTAQLVSSRVFELGQIVVSAPKVEGVAIDTTTLSSEAIYTFNRLSLDDAVNLIPGVAASNTGGSRNERVVSVRGFNRFQVPLLIDGVRVFLPADNRLDYGRFLTTDISEIQVAKGYVSVLDGSDGMGGAINLVTRKPTKQYEAQAQGTLTLDREGDYQGYNVFALLGTKQDHWYAQASYARNEVDHTTLSGRFTPTPTENGGRRELSDNDDWRLNLKAGITPNATDEYVLSYTRQEGSKKAPVSTTDPLSVQRFWTWPYWNIDSLYFLSTTGLTDNLLLKTKIFSNRFDNLLSSFDTAALNSQTLGRAFNSYYADKAGGGEVQMEWQATDANTLSAALNYRIDRHEEWQQGFPNGVTEPRQVNREATYSFGVEDVWALSPQWTLTLGASYDWRKLYRAEDYTGGAFVYYGLKDTHAYNGQGKLSYKPDADTELHFSVSSRARFPTIFERFSSRFGGAVSNPGLKPERATNYELGGSKSFGGVHLDGALFYSDISRAIVSAPFIFTSCVGAVCTPNAVAQSRNVGDGKIWGGEASISWQFNAQLDVGANYTYTKRDLNDPNNAAFRPTDVPTHKGFVYVNWSPIQRLRITPNIDLASDRWTVNSAGTRYYRTGAYAQVNLRADYTVIPNVEVGVGARNLFDDNYQLVDGFPEQGRSVFATIRARY
jgi:iron complex outermembrane receptor protein